MQRFGIQFTVVWNITHGIVMVLSGGPSNAYLNHKDTCFVCFG